MKIKFVLYVALLLITPVFSFGQTSLSTDYFKSSITGNWISPSTWQSSHDNITYFPATVVPSSVAASISIQNLHTVTISSPGVSLTNTTIQTGGTLEITSTASYSIDGTGDNLIVENGGILLLNFNTSTTPASPGGTGTALIKSNGKVIANAVINTSGANALANNYANSTCKFTYSDKSIFEWKIATFILPSTGSVGYFKTLSNTDLPIFRISTAPVVSFGSSTDNMLNCILEVNAPFNIAGNGIKTFRGGLTGISTITQTDGFITLPNASSVLDGSLTINTISSGLRFTNGVIVPIGATVKINVAAQNDIINKQSGNLQINGTLDITNCRINNTGGVGPSVTIANGGILKTSNTGGFSGSGAAIVSEPIILETNSTIEFNRSGDQNFNSRSDFKNLTFSGSGIKKPGSGFDPVGTITITGTAIFDCTGYNVSDGSTNANLTMDGGRLVVSTGSTQPRMGGVYTITGGVVEFAGATAKTIRSETYQNIEVTGSNVGNSNSNIILRDLGTFTIKTGGVFTINDNCITGPTGTQTVTVENGATFNCGNNEGFHGFSATFSNNSSIHSNIENININPGSNIVYMRNGDQSITNANSLMYQNLTIAGASGNKKVLSGTLTIQGNFSKTGASSFVHNNGTVVFSNSVTVQDYSCSSSVPVNFYNLTNENVAAGLSILNNMGIVNTLTLTTNSKLNLTSGDIILLSTATNTAKLAAVPVTASINYTGTGRFNVERYFPNNNPLSHRAWRLVTAPLNETGTIYDTWQLGGAAYSPGNYHRGTLITGPQISGNGLDYTPTNNYSLYNYDGANLISVKNTKIPLSPAISTGYLLFVRGDRNPVLTNIANNDFTTLNSRGKLQTGQVTIGASNNYSLIGNPYASPIDFNLIDKSNNVNPHRFYVFDPNLNQVGGYVTMEDYASPGIFIPTAPYAGSAQDNFIQSSQAFFVVKAASGQASISFQETNKVSNYNPAIFRPLSGQGENGEFIRANLYLLNADGSKKIADGNMAEFNETYSNNVDIADAIKFGNINETFSLTRNNQKLAVERRAGITEKDTLFYQLTRSSQRNYQFELIANINSNGLVGYLEDSYTKKSTIINLLNTNLINFEINADSASEVPNRFMLTFKNEGGPLALGFKYIRAKRENNSIALQWAAENVPNIQYFEIEKSGDGHFFTTIQTVKVIGNRTGDSYKWLDATAMQGDNFYRIKMVARNGAIVYSQVVKISLAQLISSIEIYPNPVTDGTIGLKLANQPKGVYKIRLLNSAGQVIQNNTIEHPGGSITTTVITNNDKLSSGMYQLQVIIPNKSTANFKIVINEK